MWDERFATDKYVFGKEPSLFVQKYSQQLTGPQKILLPADGEGRNSVYLAQMGHEVHAVEYSPNAIQKAEKLAAEKKVTVHFQCADLFQYPWPEASFDAVFAVFLQFADPAQRKEMFEGMKSALKPGGRIYLHGYTPKQLEYRTGGPPQRDHLYTEETLTGLFHDFQIETLSSYDAELDEGDGHKGLSALMDLVALKV